MENTRLRTVIETPEFIKSVSSLSDRETVNAFINHIAKRPKDGEVIEGTGGARKIRWSKGSGKGKRGGIRVIYLYHSSNMPIFLFTAYGKNERANINASDKSILKK